MFRYGFAVSHRSSVSISTAEANRNAVNAGLFAADTAPNLRYFEQHRPKAVSFTDEELKVKS
jgi:hypothetical protein